MIKAIKNCFVNEQVNLGRQKELDIAKGIAIIFMVFCHGFEILAWFFNPEISSDFAYTLLDVILGGSFAAPVFIFCMGISFAYSRKSSAADMLKRALKMAGIVLIFEIVRTALPGLLQWGISRDPECIEYVDLFFCVDILQFAVMSMLVIALFKKLQLKPIVMVIIAVICSVIGQLLQGVSTGSYIGDIIVGLLWYSREYAYSLDESLQALIQYMLDNNLKELQLGTRIIIVPGYSFRVVDVLVTNFHQPQSTLLLLISAFVKGDWKKIYDYALSNDFRFLSYGDSSVLFRNK